MTREEYDALPWRNDRIARKWAERYFEALQNPARVSLRMLADAVAHCEEVKTPFGDEILRRCGRTPTELEILRRDLVHYTSAVRRSCASHGIKIV